LQPRNSSRFHLQALLGTSVRSVGRDQLDGYIAFQPCVSGTIDFTHAAGAERRDNLIGAQFFSDV